jgi:phosphoribosylaminoimidazolecarboxamide formyltransferase/IMP cyclohydrolase
MADKTGLVPLGQRLVQLGWHLLASGGTARALRQASLPVQDVAEVTGFPEILGGRVKTLHPAIHAGLLARDTPEDRAQMEELGLRFIDLVACNLYPFSETVASPGVSLAEATEQIDIGGVTLLRAAAKNAARVTVLVDSADYEPTVEELAAHGRILLSTRRKLAYKAFAHTAAYDEAIRSFLAQRGFSESEPDALPPTLNVQLAFGQELRYGENPHQSAAFYRRPEVSGPLGGVLLQGKPLSYNNFLDIDAAWRIVESFDAPTLAIIKHTNACGLATAQSLAEAFAPALAGDPVSAFGSIISANREFDGATARQLGDLFVECVVAPAFTEEAREILASRSSLRLVAFGESSSANEWEFRSVRGGALLQQRDLVADDPLTWRVATESHPTDRQRDALSFAWTAVGHVKSNAILLARQDGAVMSVAGVGAGQMSRVDATRLAIWKAQDRAEGAVLASDAFFPFADSIELAVEAGVEAIVQPGGSIRDEEVIAACNRLGVPMLMTGRRHFRH